MRYLFLLLLTIAVMRPALAGEIIDASGRTVQVPDNVSRVLPAGGPAAVLLSALAPDLMLGWPNKLPPEKTALLSPTAAALPAVPHLAVKHDDLAPIVALHPDLIVDYGTVSPNYIALASTTQDKTGIATVLLDGSLGEMPRVLRALGAALHREARGEALARLAETMLVLPPPATPAPTAMYVRGAELWQATAPGSFASGVFARLGWRLLAPEGKGAFRPVTLAQIAALDPDYLVFGEPAMRATVAASPEWRALRAVRQGHAFTAPRLPFGWMEEPPSLNQLLGFAWLAGGDPVAQAEKFGAEVYGRTPTAAELHDIAEITRPLAP